MATELFANQPQTTVSSGGTDAPAGGSVETLTVNSSASFPAAVTGTSQFRILDPAAPTEIMLVTNVSGNSWTVTRGAESTTPVTHVAGYTVIQVVSAGVYGALAQSASPTLTGTLTVAGAAGTGARTLAKLENTTGAGAGFDFVGDSPSVQWGLLTDIALNGGNNFGIFDLVAGYPPQVTVAGAGGGVSVGSDTVQPSAAHSLDVVGSVQTRGAHGLSAANFVGRGTTPGAPTAGTFQVNDAMLDSNSTWYYCTSAGTPGTWSPSGGNRMGLFGDGSDGPATFDGTALIPGSSKSGSVYTLNRDVFFTTLVVTSGVTLKMAGNRVFATVSVINNGTFTVAGNAASGLTAGAATGSGGGNAGGRAGGNGGTTTGVAAGGTYTGTAGAGGSGASGAGGAASAVVATAAQLSSVYRVPYATLTGALGYANSTTEMGVGGGGGGGGDSSNSGGGGGGGGGMIIIFSPTVTNNGTMTVAGGAGATPATGNCGGGGGGSGGFILIYTLSAWTAGTTSVAGGAQGSGVGSGASGIAGTAGALINVVLL